MKKIYVYIGLVLLDLIGAFSVVLLVFTHALLVAFIFKDIYFLTIRKMSKVEKMVSTSFKVSMATFCIFVGTVVWWFTYSLYWRLFTVW